MTILMTACSTGAPTDSNPLAGQLTTRTIDVDVSGATTYSVADAPALGAGQPAGFELTYDGSSLVTRVDGTLGYDAGAGAGPSVTLHLES
ncbi:MAG TPA: hypothetical protein VJM33_07130, partial [Microthrixaceae bacterium]|nr:hypothetical protein [Microthrixaceae bacterium]